MSIVIVSGFVAKYGGNSWIIKYRQSKWIFFVALVLVVYVVCIVRLLVRKRARLKALVLLIMTLLVSCLPFVIWQKHVTDNFPNASSAKHAVSMSELGQVLTGNLSGVPQKLSLFCQIGVYV